VSAIQLFSQLEDDKQDEIYLSIGIEHPIQFRRWMESTPFSNDFDQFRTYFEEKAYLLAEQYYQNRTDNEQLAMLGVTREMCDRVLAEMKEDEEQATFPVSPVLRYVHEQMREQ
jgi:hypothetical protein